MKVRYRMAAILLFSCYACVMGCGLDDVAVYKVKVKTFWNGYNFQKNSGTKPSWSQTFGQSHNRSYVLYRIGEVASPLLRNFAQSGTPAHLTEAGEEDPKVYDQFLMPAVDSEDGDTEGVVFVDGEHSMVSFVSRMVPSSDWFIGVDSLDLCVDFSWVEQITLDLEPLEAGDGMTTERDGVWTSDSKKPIQRINFQNEGTKSFHKRAKQSALAKVEISKVKEYSTKELNDLARKELFKKPNKEDQRKYVHKRIDQEESFQRTEKAVTRKSNMKQLMDLEEEPVGTPKFTDADNNVVVVTEATGIPHSSEEVVNMDDAVLAVANGRKMGLGRHLPRHFRSRLHHAVNRNHSKDCQVSEWSTWSTCTDCGTGKSIRTRFIIKKHKRGGKECPGLIEKRPCGPCRGDGFHEW